MSVSWTDEEEHNQACKPFQATHSRPGSRGKLLNFSRKMKAGVSQAHFHSFQLDRSTGNIAREAH